MVSNDDMIHALVNECLQYALTEICQECSWRETCRIIPSLN